MVYSKKNVYKKKKKIDFQYSYQVLMHSPLLL